MRTIVIGAMILLASAALAHQGVKNPAVLARMDNMKAIANQLEIIGPMAKGAAPFDAGKAEASLKIISEESARVVGLFEAEEDDPRSEARPEIWQNFTDFEEKTRAMQVAAESAQFASVKDLQDAMRALGATCKDCHRLYRE